MKNGAKYIKNDCKNEAHFENAVAQQLLANDFDPYFCKKSKVGELDFLIELSGKVVPIEAKSDDSILLVDLTELMKF